MKVGDTIYSYTTSIRGTCPCCQGILKEHYILEELVVEEVYTIRDSKDKIINHYYKFKRESDGQTWNEVRQCNMDNDYSVFFTDKIKCLDKIHNMNSKRDYKVWR